LSTFDIYDLFNEDNHIGAYNLTNGKMPGGDIINKVSIGVDFYEVAGGNLLSIIIIGIWCAEW